LLQRESMSAHPQCGARLSRNLLSFCLNLR
jgi:hypothetical protein